MFFEEGGKFGEAVCHKTFLELLTEWQKARWAGIKRHIGVSYCALQGEEGGSFVYCSRELSRGLSSLETEVVVSMAELRFPTWMHYIDLCGDLVGWAEIGFADKEEPGVGVVGDKRGGVGEGVFLERVPDARVATGCSKVVASGC